MNQSPAHSVPHASTHHLAPYTTNLNSSILNLAPYAMSPNASTLNLSHCTLHHDTPNMALNPSPSTLHLTTRRLGSGGLALRLERSHTVPFRISLYREPWSGVEKPCTLHHQPSTKHHELCTIHNPPSTIHNLQSTIHNPQSSIYHMPSTLHHASSTIHRPSSTMHPTHQTAEREREFCMDNLLVQIHLIIKMMLGR